MAMITEKDVLHRIEEGEAAYYDVDNGVAGTCYPIGTAQMPVNNLTDLKAILTARRLSKVLLLSNMAIDSDLTGCEVIGVPAFEWRVSLNGGDVTDSAFKFVQVQSPSISGARMRFIQCVIQGFDGIHGNFYNCKFDGTQLITEGEMICGYGCSTAADEPPAAAFDFNNLEAYLVLVNLEGGSLQLRNMVADSAAEIYADKCWVEIAATCTGGDVGLWGDFDLYDSSAGTSIVDRRTSSNKMLDAVYFDAGSGFTGTDEYVGTPWFPVSSVTDLLAIMSKRGLHKVVLLSDITLDAACTNTHFTGGWNYTLNINGQDVDGCTFSDISLRGTATGDYYAVDCNISNNLSAGGGSRFIKCLVIACTITIVVPSEAATIFMNCGFDRANIDVNTTGEAYLYGCYGELAHVQNVAHVSSRVRADFTVGQITLDNSCTAGNIYLYGDFRLTDNSAGSTVNDYRKITETREGYIDACSYLEQTVPILMNSTHVLTNVAANKDFIASNTTGASGLISTDDSKVQKAFLLIIGRAENTYDGVNELDCSTATHNQWQMNLDGGAYSDLTNEEADGQMLDGDWECQSLGVIHPFTFMFDVTAQLTNIDGKIGVRLENGRSDQASLIVICDIYLKVVWKL